jgi:O-antigen/teichoic acid export membrane protein
LSKIKRLAGETALYGLGSILPRLLNFFLIRPQTDVYDPIQYGIITKLFAFVAVINIIFMFGMETAYFRFAAKPGADEKKIFNLSQTTVIGISIFLSLIFIAATGPIAAEMNVSERPSIIYELIALMFIDAVVAIPFARLRLQKKALQFAAGKLINIALVVGLNLYFLYVIYDPAVGVEYIILANLVANSFYILFFIRTLISWRPAFDKEISPAMISYAYPVMLTGLAGMTNEMFSRMALEWWLPENFYPGQSAKYALGIFGGCYKFAVLMSLAVQAFRYAAEPFFFSHAADKNSPALFAQINHYFIIVCCILLLGVGINMDIIKYFLGDAQYWQGINIVPVLLLGYLFLGVYYNMTVWFKLTDKTYYGTIISIAGVVIIVVANYILIPVAGYMGSSWATVICYFAMTLLCYILGRKYYPIPYRVLSGLVYIASTFLLVYLIKAIPFENQWIATGFHILIIGVYVITIYIFERKDFKRSMV